MFSRKLPSFSLYLICLWGFENGYYIITFLVLLLKNCLLEIFTHLLHVFLPGLNSSGLLFWFHPLNQTEDIQSDVFLFPSPRSNTNSDNSYCLAAWLTVSDMTVRQQLFCHFWLKSRVYSKKACTSAAVTVYQSYVNLRNYFLNSGSSCILLLQLVQWIFPTSYFPWW